MLFRQYAKGIAAFTVPATIWALFAYQPVSAANDNNGSQDEKQMIQTGLSEAASLAINLTITSQDPDLVGLGSYLVNITSGCNICHSPVFINSAFAPNGNPYFLPPVFSGQKQADPRYYLGGNQNLGPVMPGYASIISRNLTPDKTGQPAGLSLQEFMQVIKTGIDLDHLHPNCAPDATDTSNCVPYPVNGALLQVMPWAFFQNMTDRQLTAIYTYLSTIPCLEGGPGEPPNRCQ